MEKRLVDFSSERYCKALLRNMMPVQTDIPDSFITTTDAADGLYTVKSASSDKVYTVDLGRGYCTCYSGATGSLCKHASAVLLHADAEFSTAYNIVSCETKAQLFEVGTGKYPSAEWLLPLCSIPGATGTQPTSSRHDEDSNDTVEYSPTEPASPRETTADAQYDTLTPEDRERMENLFARIRKGIDEAPQIFVPACRHLVDNAEKFTATETGLVSALYTFGKYSGLPRAKQQHFYATNIRKRRGVQLGVQPTAIGRRRLTLPGKRKVAAGRPQGIVTARSSRHLSTHDYTAFGTLPSRKRKAPHSLQECVYRNTGIGRTKHAKNIV